MMGAPSILRALVAFVAAGYVLANSPIQARNDTVTATTTPTSGARIVPENCGGRTTVTICNSDCCDYRPPPYTSTVIEIQTVNVTNTVTQTVTQSFTTLEISPVPTTTTATRVQRVRTTITVSACEVTSAPAQCCVSDECSVCPSSTPSGDDFSTPAGDPSPTDSPSPDPTPEVVKRQRQTVNCVVSTTVVWSTSILTDIETITAVSTDFERFNFTSTATATDFETVNFTSVATVTETRSVPGPTSLLTVTETDFSTLNFTATEIDTVTSVEEEVLTVTQPGQTVIESGPVVTVTEPASTVLGPGATVTEPGETVIESGPVVTVTEPGETIIESGSVVTEPGATVTEPGQTIVESGSVVTVTQPASTVIRPGTTVVEPGSTVTEPASTVIEPGTTVTEPASTVVVTESAPGHTITLTTSVIAPVITCAAPTNSPGLAVTFDPKSDLTWGCKPGYVCSPKKPDHCNVWADSPADSFLCAPADCKPAPAFPVVTWPANETGFYPPTDDFFNLDPEAFGLSFDIFQEEVIVEEVDGKTVTVTTGNFASQTTLTHFPPTPAAAAARKRSLQPHAVRQLSKRDSTVVPAICYDTCNNCYLEAQQVGKTPALCDPASAFEQYYQGCQECVSANAPDVKATEKTYLQPKFQQFTTFCDVLDAQPALASSAGPASQVQSAPPVQTASQGAQNTNTAPKPISTGAGAGGSTVSSALAAGTTTNGPSPTPAGASTLSTPGTSTTTSRSSATSSHPATVTAGASQTSRTSSWMALFLPLLGAVFVL